MSTFPPGINSSSSNQADSLEQEAQEARLQRIQLTNQLQAQLVKESKGPSTFRKILGAATGVAAGIFAPGLGGSIGSMVAGGGSQASAVNSLAMLNTLNAMNDNAGGAQNQATLSAISAMNASNASFQAMNEQRMQSIQKEMNEIAATPKGTDPVAYLALAEKTNHDSEVFQATTAVAKAKHEAAMAAIQNIKD